MRFNYDITRSRCHALCARHNFHFRNGINELQPIRAYENFLDLCVTLGHYVHDHDLTATYSRCYNKTMNTLPAVSSARKQQDLQIEALRALQSEIPLNDFGLPTGIYRTDLLPFHDYDPSPTPAHVLPESRSNGLGSPEEPEDDSDGSRVHHPVMASQEDPLEKQEYRIAGFPAAALSHAYVPLQYDEGFPAFANGSSFWNRLEYEPGDAFQAFERYLSMNLGRAADVEEDDDYGQAATGTRSISQLATILHPDSDLLAMSDTYQGYYHLYYWGARAHAYDLFRVAQYRQQQDLRAIETQDEHYVIARRLRAKLMQYFETEDDFMDMMTPKVAIDFFKNLTGLERISAGVPAAGPQTAEQAGEAGKPFELHLKTVAQTNRPASSSTTIDEDGEVLDKALQDPATTELLQEIIIRSGG